MINYVENILQFILPFGAVTLAFLGNYYLQHRVARRHQDADRIKHRLYELLELAADYWTMADTDYKLRQGLEARIIVGQLVISNEMKMVARKSKRLRRWYEETKPSRLALMEAVTGGCFQQTENWHQDASRIQAATKEIASIVQSLDRAC